MIYIALVDKGGSALIMKMEYQKKMGSEVT